jgi:hypothetical protein
VSDGPSGSMLSFKPNLARDRVSFDAELKSPIRFREAISALHDVVVGDLRFKPKDKTAYRQWKAEQDRQEQALRRAAFEEAKKSELQALKSAELEIPPNLEVDFERMHRLYWNARRKWANELSRNDPELFRHLVPCDPVVTVAPDTVFFECFAKDESSYGCLFVDRDSFRGDGSPALGTTNVDYSLALYEHFQTLRSYRPTRLLVDPSGFEVKVEGHEDYREEKIDLPPSWLRGFGQLQAAMGLPTRRVELSTGAVYSLLAYLKRHRERSGPRSLRFQLTPGKPASIVLEPWGVQVPSAGAPYRGEQPEEIKVWGRRRLFALARVLPLAEKVEVQLLGSGLPSVWIVHMGDMRMVLALSGWTANDWTSGTNLDLLSGSLRVDARVVDAVTRLLMKQRQATLSELAGAAEAPRDALLGSLHLLAKQGQVVFDFATSSYRYRSVMPVALSESLLGPEPPEVAEGRRLFASGQVTLKRDELLPGARRHLMATVKDTTCEGLLDPDGRFTQAKCGCSHFYKFRLRNGPCRHLLALRLKGTAPEPGPSSTPEPGSKRWIH